MTRIAKISKKIQFFSSWFGLLLILFIIKGWIWAAFVTPPALQTSPDDIGHLSYIQYIYSQKKLPVLYETKMEEHSQDLAQQYMNNQSIGQVYVQTESFNNQPVNYIAQHPPLYYLLMVIPYAFAKLITTNLTNIILILRLVTLSTGIFSLIFVKRIVSLLDLEDIVQKSILIFFTFSTPIGYYFITVSNDSLLILLCLISLYFLLRYEKDLKQSSFNLFCVSSACVLITKYTGAIVILGYLIYFLYFSLHKHGIIKTGILCLQGLIIGGCICFPCFIRNYYLYGSPVKTYDDNSRLFDYTLKQFICDGYIFEICRAIICLIGAKKLIYTPTAVLIVPAIILSSLTFYTLRNLSRVYSIIFLVIESTILIANCVLQNEYIYFCVIIFNVLILIGYEIFFEKQQYLKRLSKFFAFLLLITFLIYGWQHYIIFCHRGYYGAMHGRYYYIALFPFAFLIFRSSSCIPTAARNIALSIEFLLLIFFDFYIMQICLGGW